MVAKASEVVASQKKKGTNLDAINKTVQGGRRALPHARHAVTLHTTVMG